MVTSSSSEDKTPEIECDSGSIVPISKLSSNYPLIPREELVVQEQLGAGTYGSVFKGLWRVKYANQPIVVALKKVFMLEREVDILSQVRHRNIIHFFGVSHANPDFYIVTEYAENASLFEYLHNAKADLSCERILKWARQIAHGVAYLHYEAPKTIIHRDLKSKNVVLGKKLVCKICDFGTSKDLTHSKTAPTWGGTAAWMSPEIVNQREGITTATDVWSYAVLLWEMLAREIPYNGLTDFKIYSITIHEGCRLVVPESCPEALSDLLRQCWHKEPTKRIDMREIVGRLDAIQANKDVQNECATFVSHKESWQRKIKEQMEKLNALELDYERKREELTKWEQMLRKRESSHRNFLHIIELMNTTNVADWNPECVCEWIQYMAAGAENVISEEIIDKIISRVLQHEIRGSRLLQVTARDLENLGIASPEICYYIVEKIDELRTTACATKNNVSSPILTNNKISNADFVNFPSLQMSAELEARNKNKNKYSYEQSIVLVMGFYSRVTSRGLNLRFKVFLDSDWDDSKELGEMPMELNDSATVIKDVYISMTNADSNTVLLDTVRCVCPPFGYLEWVEVEAARCPVVNVTMSVTYTDQVMQPRNTRISVKIDNLQQPSKNVCTKIVELKIRPEPTNTSLSRINSSIMNNEQSPTSPLQGVWRARRGSIDSHIQTTGEGCVAAVNGVIPPIASFYSDIAAFRHHYEQRMVRRHTNSLNLMERNVGDASSLSDVVDPSLRDLTVNNQTRNTSKSLKSGGLQSNRKPFTAGVRSASVYTKMSTTSRRRPLLTLAVCNSNNSSSLKGNVNHMDTLSSAKSRRWRRSSETETIISKDSDKSPTDGTKRHDRPTFYVSNDPDSPSSSMDLTTCYRKAAESGKTQSINGSECTNCSCRQSRRNKPPTTMVHEEENEDPKADASVVVSAEEFPERKNKPKPAGYRKMKKTTSRQRMEKEQQRQHHASTNGRKAEADPNDSFGENERKLSTGDGGGVEKKIPIPQPKYIYGGYNKWRWKT